MSRAWMATLILAMALPAGAHQMASATLGLAVSVQHGATLTWTASVPGSDPAAGYAVYRGTVSGGPYVMLNTALITGTTYEDGTVKSGATYFYVAAAVDSAGATSIFSNEAKAVVPLP